MSSKVRTFLSGEVINRSEDIKEKAIARIDQIHEDIDQGLEVLEGVDQNQKDSLLKRLDLERTKIKTAAKNLAESIDGTEDAILGRFRNHFIFATFVSLFGLILLGLENDAYTGAASTLFWTDIVISIIYLLPLTRIKFTIHLAIYSPIAVITVHTFSFFKTTYLPSILPTSLGAIWFLLLAFCPILLSFFKSIYSVISAFSIFKTADRESEKLQKSFQVLQDSNLEAVHARAKAIEAAEKLCDH
ncbi:MAG: hypothetical protein RRB13_14040 [bacterium]|nr:hypothetical protein [bacterium]